MQDNKKILEIAQKGSEKYFNEQMDILKEFCKIDCSTGMVCGNQEVVKIIKKIFDTMNVSLEEVFVENIGTHLIARIKPENPSGKIIISAHTDTFTGFKAGDTAKHPFRIEGDWAYGIGISDCKAGIISSIYSVKIMQEANMLPNKEIVMIYNADEETGSNSSKAIFEKECKDADMVYVFEPSRDDNGIITQRKGIVIANLEITGKAAHACIAYKEGRSASKELAHQTIRLFDITDFENITVDVGKMHSNTSISDYASARICASLKNEKGIVILNKLFDEIENGKPFVDGCTCKITSDVAHPMMNRNEKNLKMLEGIQKAGELIGQKYPEQLSEGSSDACLFAGYGVPTVDALGPYMKDIHSTNERMYIPSLSEKTTMFAIVLAKMI